MSWARVLFATSCCVSTSASADIRSLDLSTTFGWEVENAADDVARALDERDQTFFASGDLGCVPLAIPPEFAYLVKDTHILHCGDHFPRETDEERGRRHIQLEYARAYNEALLRKLRPVGDWSTIDGIVSYLPDPREVEPVAMRVIGEERAAFTTTVIGRIFNNSEAGRTNDRQCTQSFAPSLSSEYRKLGVVNVGTGWRYSAISYPENPAILSAELDGRPIAFVPITSVRDETLMGAHVVASAFSDRPGWMLVTVTDNYSAISATAMTGRGVYRFVTSPSKHLRAQIVLHAPADVALRLQPEVVSDLAANPAAMEVERRHQAVLSRWLSDQ